MLILVSSIEKRKRKRMTNTINSNSQEWMIQITIDRVINRIEIGIIRTRMIRGIEEIIIRRRRMDLKRSTIQITNRSIRIRRNRK